MRLENGYVVIEASDSIEECDKTVGDILQEELDKVDEYEMQETIRKLDELINDLGELPRNRIGGTQVCVIECLRHLAYQNVMMCKEIAKLKMKLKEKENEQAI